ncbi:MAG: hypothetical protein Q9226_005528 [Calogaya cf. arnoldii]
MSDENALLDFRKRFDELQVADSQRQTLIQNQKLLCECKQIGQDLVIEKDARRHLQTRIKDELEPLTNRRGFVLVLIDADGDGYIFHDNFLNKNEEGGRLAADELSAQVKQHINSLNLDAENTDVIVRAYANVRGLGKACVKNNLMKSTADLGLFANGFTGRHPLFDFVDVGLGKERADHKIRELFHFYINSLQCKHVLLGVSHDSGYVPFLEQFVADEAVRDRVTLLEGYQVSPAIRNLGFKRSVRFPSVFAPGWTPVGQSSASQAQLPTPVTASRVTKGPFQSSAVDSSRLGPVMKNEKGQRIDKDLNVDPGIVQAIQKKNLCQWLFLKGTCVGCERNHAHSPLNKREYNALWSVARRASCYKDRKAKGCNDPTCIYGHPAKPVSNPGPPDVPTTNDQEAVIA